MDNPKCSYPRFLGHLSENISMENAIRTENTVAILRLITEEHYNLSEKISDQKYTALHYAIMLGRINVIRLLLENGADVNVLDDDNRTPLHYAGLFSERIENKIQQLQLLKQYNANPHCVDNEGNKAIDYCDELSSVDKPLFNEFFGYELLSNISAPAA